MARQRLSIGIKLSVSTPSLPLPTGIQKLGCRLWSQRSLVISRWPCGQGMLGGGGRDGRLRT